MHSKASNTDSFLIESKIRWKSQVMGNNLLLKTIT